MAVSVRRLALQAQCLAFVAALACLAGPAHAWSTTKNNAKFAVADYFAQEWNVTLTLSRGDAKRTHTASWALVSDEDGDTLTGDLVAMQDDGRAGKACHTVIDVESELTARMVQQCGKSPPSVYELSFTRIDEQALMASGPVTREGEVSGMYQVTVSSPFMFTMVLTAVEDGETTIRTLVCHSSDPGRSWTNRVLLGVLCLALVVSQIYVKRRMRASMRHPKRTSQRAKGATAGGDAKPKQA